MKKKPITWTIPVDVQFFAHNLTAKERDQLERDREAIDRIVTRGYGNVKFRLALIEQWITTVEGAIIAHLPFVTIVKGSNKKGRKKSKLRVS